MVKRINLLFLLLFLCSFISAVPPVTTVANFNNGYIIVESQQEYIKINQDYKYNFFVYNYSNGLVLDNSTLLCKFFLANSSGDVIYNTNATYYLNGYWGVNIGAGNFSATGIYPYGVSCQDGSGGALSGDWEVTYLGKMLNVAESILYLGFFSLMVLLFITNFIAISYLPSRNKKDEEGRIMSISYLKYLRNVLALVGYFLFIAIFYLASNIAFAFLQEELFAKTLFMVFRLSFLMAPIVIIIWLIWIFASMFHDKEFQNMLNRGMFPQGRI